TARIAGKGKGNKCDYAGAAKAGRRPPRQTAGAPESVQTRSAPRQGRARRNAGKPRAWAETCLVLCLVPAETGGVPIGGEDLGEGGLGPLHVDAQKRLVGGRVERVLGRHHLAAEQPGQAAGVEIAALERLFAEALPECGHEGLVGQPVDMLAVAEPLAPDDLGRAFLEVGAADGELQVGAGKTA